jgi:putative transposase
LGHREFLLRCDAFPTSAAIEAHPVLWLRSRAPFRSAIHLARTYGERKFAGQSFLARGYFVSTVGREAIREYIKNQEQEDKRLDQLNLWR